MINKIAKIIKFNYDEKLQRSEDYRSRYFLANKGILNRFYFCPYCGKLMWSKRKMQIDHIYAVRNVQLNKKLMKKFEQKEDGINSISNLTVSCIKCNKRKSSKGGLWVLRGKYGVYFMPFFRYLIFLIVIIFISKYFEPIKNIFIYLVSFVS